MRIGVDTSGKFETFPAFHATVVAAAAAPEHAMAEIEAWTDDALVRWDLADDLGELHAKELRAEHRLEVCQMLADRGDVRLAAIVTDSGLLGSPEAVQLHRRRQRCRAGKTSARSEEGGRRRQALLQLLDSRSLRDHEYLLAACLPLVLAQIAQRLFGFFAGDEWETEMSTMVVRVDQETAPTMRYSDSALLPTFGGDDRFAFRFPESWREPVHPLLARVRHPDGDGVRPQMLFDDIRWVSSHDDISVQLADVAAWILARRISRPTEEITSDAYELIAPLMAGEGGRTFELFSIPPVRPDQAAMYSHLQSFEEPQWWLKPADS
ncbi:MAG: hypothetical protein QOI31_2158 [Solirubrobacterales bacterium]|jgi:hypothetical protein|nr:hypothetical protein [Solirubrobacterales bacterium]